MTPADAVAKVQQILSGHFPPGYFHEPERFMWFLADDGALCGLIELMIRAEDANKGDDDEGLLVVAVEVRTALLPSHKFGYHFVADDLANVPEHTLRASWLFSLVRAYERALGFASPAMEAV